VAILKPVTLDRFAQHLTACEPGFSAESNNKQQFDGTPLLYPLLSQTNISNRAQQCGLRQL
jgi:hypothetical protein